MVNMFNRGDVVQLKSGGPAMTIDAVPGEASSKYDFEERTTYRCEWFKGATPANGNYAEHLLQVFVAPEKT